MTGREHRILEVLLSYGEADIGWGWLDDCAPKGCTKRQANKFLLACILDYQMNAEVVWRNAARLTEEELGDPDDLWRCLVERFSTGEQLRRAYPWLHRYPVAYDRLIRIAGDIVLHWEGDARAIWQTGGPAEILDRLQKMKVGPQISRMVVGALKDRGQISEGSSDLKADSNVTRVLGRCLQGAPMSALDAQNTARRLYPQDPWQLDRGLYFIGKDYCRKNDPSCDACPLAADCAY